MKKTTLSLLFVLVVGFLAFSFAHAAIKVDDVIKMENKIYKKHTKSIVTFTHKKHSEDYNISCGECHHDATGKALTSLKAGDDVKNCAECHKIGEKAPMKKGDKRLTKKEKLDYHADAIHQNCIDCHKEHNKKNKIARNDPKFAPQSCTQCHPK